MDFSRQIFDFGQNGHSMFGFDHAEEAAPRHRVPSGLSTHFSKGLRDDDDNASLYESSDLVVRTVLTDDEGDEGLYHGEGGDSTSSGYDGSNATEKELYDYSGGMSPTCFMSTSPDQYDTLDQTLPNGLTFNYDYNTSQRMETSFDSKSSVSSGYADHGTSGYGKAGSDYGNCYDEGIIPNAVLGAGNSFYNGYGNNQGKGYGVPRDTGSMNLLGPAANKLMAHAVLEKRGLETQPMKRSSPEVHTPNDIQPSKQCNGLGTESTLKKKPIPSPLILANVPNSNTAAILAPFSYYYSNVAGAIKSPNTQDGLLGESPFHHTTPGMMPYGYPASPMGMGYAPIQIGHKNQGFFQYPPTNEMANANFYHQMHGRCNNMPYMMQAPQEKYPPVVPIDKASAKHVPDLSHGILPLCEELDLYPGPYRLKKFAAVRHVRQSEKADYFDHRVVIAEILLRALEKERQRVESDLARRFPGKRISSAPSATMTQYSAPGGNHTLLDRLILDCSIEHTKVMTILGKMEGILAHPVHPDIREDIGDFKACVVRLQNARKHEINVVTKLHDEGIAHSPAGVAGELQSFEALLACVQDLHRRARAARSALYGAHVCVALRDTYPDLSNATFLPVSRYAHIAKIGDERRKAEKAAEEKKKAEKEAKLAEKEARKKARQAKKLDAKKGTEDKVKIDEV